MDSEDLKSGADLTSAAISNKNLTEEEILLRDVRGALQDQLTPQQLDIKAEVGCGGSAKLEIFIVSDKFEGLPLLKRHRAVQQAVRSIQNYEQRIHAITITKSVTPQQFEQSTKSS